MMHVKYEVFFENNLPTFKHIIAELEEISKLNFDCLPSPVGSWHNLFLSQFSNIEIELDEKIKKVTIVTPTHRLYYLEGVLLWALKNLGGMVNEKLPFWVKLPYEQIDSSKLKNIPGQPQYKKKWWESIFNFL